MIANGERVFRMALGPGMVGLHARGGILEGALRRLAAADDACSIPALIRPFEAILAS